MSQPDVVKFSCYQCSQHIRAFREHIGESIMCPSCGTMITVPAVSQFDEKVEELVVQRKFTDEELDLIRQEGAGAYEAFIGGAVSKYWQFALVADLLTKRLSPLQQSVLDLMRRQVIYDREVVNHGPFIKFVNAKAEEFFGILYMLTDRLAGELDRVIYEDNLSQIITFSNQVGVVILRLRKFHDSIYEQPLPGEYPYPELQGIMKSWAPHCWQSIKNVTEELRQLSVRKRNDGSWKAMQMAFAPALLHEFYYHLKFLPEPEPDLFQD